MSGDKPETEDTASRPTSSAGDHPILKVTGNPATSEPSAAMAEDKKVSVLEGLSGMKPRNTPISEPTSVPEAAKEPKGDAPKMAEPKSATDKPSAEKPATSASPSSATDGVKKPFEPSSAEPMSAPTTSAAPPLTPSPSPPASEAKPRRSGIVAPLFGGILAAGLGFGLAHYVPEGWPIGPGSDRLAALQRQIEAQEARIAELSARAPAAPDETLAPRLAALEAKAGEPADLGPLQAEIDALKSSLATLSTGAAPADLAPLRSEFAEQIAALKAEIEAMPRTNPADLEALREAARAEREAIEARAEATRAEAEATARAAIIRGAVLRVQAALESGAPFDAALSDLGAAGVALPQALSSHASGVPALSALQARFPEAARKALAASSRPGPEAGIGDRFAAFLSVQTGLRSLTPQEGSTPDAVLSRAEAAVAAGDLATALSELDALPPEGAAELADWRAGAQARLAASAAAQSLIADLDKP